MIEDDSVLSNPTSLVNLQGGYALGRNAKIAIDIFNVLDAAASDIDYYYASRLPGEPVGGVTDIHTHPTLPRAARATLILAF